MSGLDSAWAFLRKALLREPTPLVFDDRVGSWANAKAQSSGYDQQAIVEQVTRATQAVLAGEATFERDGVTFFEPEYRWPIAYSLMRAFANSRSQDRGELRVLDFGGSLGSVYFQHRALLPSTEINWTVIEQPAYVAAGRAHCGAPLNFAGSIHELDTTEWDLALFSSVLQYLDDPWTSLREVMALGTQLVAIDRTPFHTGSQDIPTVQHVPEHIYAASYPAWILSHQRLLDEFKDWRIIATFPGIEPNMRTQAGVPFTWSGCIAERIAP